MTDWLLQADIMEALADRSTSPPDVVQALRNLAQHNREVAAILGQREVDVDGRVDAKNDQIRFIGKARRQTDGTWRCIADVGGALCVVQVKITEEKE